MGTFAEHLSFVLGLQAQPLPQVHMSDALCKVILDRLLIAGVRYGDTHVIKFITHGLDVNASNGFGR